jgi:hypothetical protein
MMEEAGNVLAAADMAAALAANLEDVQQQQRIEAENVQRQNNFVPGGENYVPAHPPPLYQPAREPVRLPEFWSSNPNMWFAQAEAAFRRGQVFSSIVRYDYVLMKLNEEVLRSVQDLVQSVTDDTVDAYEQLKFRLLASFGLSKWQLAGKIIDHPAAGDARPSALLDSMLSLLPPGEPPGVLFMAHFLRKLPADIRDHLCSRNFATPREMGVFADQLWDGRGGLSASSVAAISSSSRANSRSPARGRRQSKSPGSAGGGRRKQTPGPGSEGLCFYHANFAEKAHKCKPGCTWSGNAPAAGSN